LDAALGLDAASQELIFIVGPLLVAGANAVGGPGRLALGGRALGVVGTCAFLLAPPREPGGRCPASRTGWARCAAGGWRCCSSRLVGSGVALGAMTLFAVAVRDGRAAAGQ